MTFGPESAPRAVDDTRRWQRWVEDQLKLLRSSRGTLDRGSVAGGVVTVREILTAPNAPLVWIDTDTVTYAGPLANVLLPLSAIPYSRTLIVKHNGCELEPSEWTRVGPLVTIPVQPWFTTGDVFSAYYATDTVTPAAQVTGPVITTPAAGSSVNDLTPTVSGTGAEGRTITLYIDGTAVGSSTISGGTWSITSTLLTAGAHTAVAHQAELTGPELLSPAVTFTLTKNFAAYMASITPLWWDRLGEASGTVGIDSSGNTHNGIATNVAWGQPSLVNGDPDTAAFWTNPGRIEVPYGAWMNAATISGFILFKTTNADAFGPICLMSRYDASVALLWSFELAAGNANLQLRLNGATVTTTGLTLNDGNQQMAGFTYDGTTVKLYTKAGLVKSQSAPGLTITGATGLMVGADRGGGGGTLLHHFQGTLDEAAYEGDIWSADNFKTLWEMAA